MLTPTNTAIEQSPSFKLLRAACSATNDDEPRRVRRRARPGPCSPKLNEMRPAATDIDPDVASYTDSCFDVPPPSTGKDDSSPWPPEALDIPTKTPARWPLSPSSE